MSAKQTAQSLTVDVLLTLEVEDLETLVQRGNAALAAKAKQTQQISPSDQSPLKCFASGPVKLNVGGTYFSTSLDNLTREPGTFFSALLSGKWEVNPKDGAVFVDRSPSVFAFIIDYMRTGEIVLDDLSSNHFNALLKEADFYGIASLSRLLQQSSFSPEIRGTIQLSKGNSCATHLGDSMSYVTSLVAFSPSVREMKVKLLKGRLVMIGVAPKSILEAGSTYRSCGWHVQAYNGVLYGQSGGKQLKRRINEGSMVTVKLDEDFNILFRVDEEAWGVAVPKAAKDYSVPLHLVISLYQPNDAVEMLLCE